MPGANLQRLGFPLLARRHNICSVGVPIRGSMEVQAKVGRIAPQSFAGSEEDVGEDGLCAGHVES